MSILLCLSKLLMFVCIIIIIIILFPCHIAKGTLQKKSVWKKSNAVNFDLFLEGVCQLKVHFSKPFYCEAQARVRQGSARDGP